MKEVKDPLRRWRHDLRGELGTALVNVELGTLIGEELGNAELLDVFGKIRQAIERSTVLLTQQDEIATRGEGS